MPLPDTPTLVRSHSITLAICLYEPPSDGVASRWRQCFSCKNRHFQRANCFKRGQLAPELFLHLAKWFIVKTLTQPQKGRNTLTKLVRELAL